MNNIVVNKMLIKIGIIIFFFIIGLFLEGCTGRYIFHESGKREAILSLAGGAAGALVSSNAAGAIAGVLVTYAYSNALKITYEDKKIESGDEAARRLNPKFEKAEAIKDPEKKVEELRGRQQRAEKKRNEERVKLFIEEPQDVRQEVKAGSPVEARIQYSVLAADDVKEVTITEKRMLLVENKYVELDTRKIVREQGTYSSTIMFMLPDEANDYCTLYITISTDGKSSRTSKTVIHKL